MPPIPLLHSAGFGCIMRATRGVTVVSIRGGKAVGVRACIFDLGDEFR